MNKQIFHSVTSTLPTFLELSTCYLIDFNFPWNMSLFQSLYECVKPKTLIIAYLKRTTESVNDFFFIDFSTSKYGKAHFTTAIHLKY